jgi:putative nucleotidyltransferase with HDIG domain
MSKNKEIYKINFLQGIYDLNIIIKFDSITYKHSVNVARYAVQFVKTMGYDFNESLVYYSGLFHDIGKTQIDAEILNKTCTLNKNEFDKIKQHPSIGHTILLNADLPNEILEAAQFHHERYDGGGYPMGIKAAEIPLLARIISICDVFDALTSDRSYRKAYSTDEAIQVMNKSKGQFDPELFSIFSSNIPKLLYSNEIFSTMVI